MQTLSRESITVRRVGSGPQAQSTDDCDPWDNTGHDGGPYNGGNDFNSWDCG